MFYLFPRMPTFTTQKSLTLGYTDQGHGPAVAFLHPFPLDSRAWVSQIALLAPEHRVIAIDFPGFGTSGPPPSGLTLGTMAGAVAELLRELGIFKATVIGLSMGGYIALELAAQEPSLLANLVLADTRAGPDSKEGAAGRERFAVRAEKDGVGWIADEMLPKLLRPTPDPDVVRQVASLIARASPAGIAAAQRAMATRADHGPTLEGLKMPVLVLVGGQDVLTPPQESVRMVERLPRGRLEILPGAGHLSNLEEQERFNRALVSFITD
jgi:pimeloyl-ACP methyl ester carboxylesterase